MKKPIYDNYILKIALYIYGKESDIYKNMVNGEFVSAMIKADIKKKGKANWRKINDKKLLFRLCKEKEGIISQNEQGL